MSVIKSGPSIRHIVFNALGFLGFPAVKEKKRRMKMKVDEI